MKKLLFSLPLVIMTITGCTSEDVVDISRTQGNAIGFENVVNKPSRAIDGDLSNTSFDNFMVYGYYIKPNLATPIQIFNGVPVRKVGTGASAKWQYEGTRYWIPECTYFFYAYSCADVELASGYGAPAFSLFDANNTTVDGRALLIQNYLCDDNHQHDLVYAESENVKATEKNNQQVKFSFAHALCKIKAVFTTDFPQDYKVYISNVYVNEFYGRADFNVGTASWGNYTRDVNNAYKTSLSLPAENFVENKAGSKVETSEIFIIPKNYDTQNSENVRLHFTVNVIKDNETIIERNIVGTWSPQWTKGNIYTYNINITGSSAGIEPIVFAAEQNLSGTSSWDDTTQLNMIFGLE